MLLIEGRSTLLNPMLRWIAVTVLHTCRGRGQIYKATHVAGYLENERLLKAYVLKLKLGLFYNRVSSM